MVSKQINKSSVKNKPKTKDVVKTEVPKTEVPKTEVSKTEVPKTEVSKTEVSKTEVSKTEVPKTEVPKTKAPSAKTSSAKVSDTSVGSTKDTGSTLVVDVQGTDTPAEATTSPIEEKAESKESSSVESVFYNKLSNFISKVSLINKEVKELQSMGKTLERDFNNVIKTLSKQKNKNKNSRNASGFAMPALLTPEMYEFLQIKEGELVPRNDVTKMLNAYIVKNGLRLEENKRILLPDEKLKKIFNCTDDDEVNYFNLQSYIKHHFIKPPQATKAVAV